MIGVNLVKEIIFEQQKPIPKRVYSNTFNEFGIPFL